MNVHEMAKWFKGSTPTENGYVAPCPACAHDSGDPRPLSLGEAPDGRVLLSCGGGCEVNDVLGCAGLRYRDLFPSSPVRSCTPKSSGGTDAAAGESSSDHRGEACGLTLAAYAEHMMCPIEFLRESSLWDDNPPSGPALAIAYLGSDRKHANTRYQIKLEGPDNFKWGTGDSPMIYGLHDLGMIQSAGWVYLAESEADWHIAGFNHIPVLAIPSGERWDEGRFAQYFAKIPRVYVGFAINSGASELLSALMSSSIRDKVWVVAMPDHKNLTDLYRSAPPLFIENLQRLIKGARQPEPFGEAFPPRKRYLRHAADRIVRDPDILGSLCKHLEGHGLVGEERVTKLMYIIANSRFQSRPLGFSIQGLPGTGANFVAEKVLRTIPASACEKYETVPTNGSADHGEVGHTYRFCKAGFAGRGTGEERNNLLFTLFPKDQYRYRLVKDIEEVVPSEIKAGEFSEGAKPAETSQTQAGNAGTRIIPLSIDDSEGQTARVLEMMGNIEGATAPNDLPWLCYQEDLAYASFRPVVPWASVLLRLMDTSDPGVREWAGIVLDLIRTHTNMNQMRRRISSSRLLVFATIEDYDAVYPLIQDVIDEALGVCPPKAVMRVLEAVKRLHAKLERDVTCSDLADDLKMSVPSVRRHALAAIDLELLHNHAVHGAPLLLEPARDSLPQRTSVLPTPDALRDAIKKAEEAA
jgi:hypothetical protein